MRRLDFRTVCSAARGPDRDFVSRGYPGKVHVRRSGFRNVRLPFGVLSSGEFLARGTAVLESVEQLRAAVPGPMEHFDALPAFAHLPVASSHLVTFVLLPGSSILGRTGHVFLGPALDQPSAGRGPGRADFCVQWSLIECPDVA